MPRGGLPGESGNKDGNAGALLAPECPQHHGDSGGGKIPPPTVRPMQHAGHQAGLERTSPLQTAPWPGDVRSRPAW